MANGIQCAESLDRVAVRNACACVLCVVKRNNGGIISEQHMIIIAQRIAEEESILTWPTLEI